MLLKNLFLANFPYSYPKLTASDLARGLRPLSAGERPLSAGGTMANDEALLLPAIVK